MATTKTRTRTTNATTEARKTQAEARRAAFRELAEKVSAMTDEERSAIVDRCGAVVSIERRALSINNTLLILTQLPTASVVAGFRQWLDAGRCVKKGERGLSLWIPTGRGEATEQPETDAPADGTEPKKARARFVMGTVFDISQTCPLGEAPTTAEDAPQDWTEQ